MIESLTPMNLQAVFQAIALWFIAYFSITIMTAKSNAHVHVTWIFKQFKFKTYCDSPHGKVNLDQTYEILACCTQ